MAQETDMEYRYLGNTGLKVSVLSLGGWVTYGGQVGEDACYECMKLAWDNGVNFFDTAEVYAGGQSEVDMGKAIRKLGIKRSDVVVSTKIFWGGKGVNDRGLSRKHIIEGLMASLKRLEMDYVDIVFAHRPDPETPMEETVRAFNYCIDKGWVFYWGTSEWSAQQIQEACAIADKFGLIKPVVEQPQYNMFHRERFETEYEPLYKQIGLGTTIWSPLAGGILTGKYNDGVPQDSRFAMKDNEMMKRFRDGLSTEEGKAKLAKVRKLGELAKRLDTTTAALALAWTIKNKNVSTVIMGASKPSQITDNVSALKTVPKLTDEIMEEIEGILDNKPKPNPTFR
ncbi:hypothetical protein BZG36_02617 [Bifiguratus adelaidae]|uniref:NADP-dependent oxidoreductase domain-containing protein n=1 Tax=Bifiguratus adelaidae TaxID=1938954 RepID=A0A261Y2J5_9FUNG|nr:hypothetical protein BZG36_02617 [Bifiguratus adelaidae]